MQNPCCAPIPATLLPSSRNSTGRMGADLQAAELPDHRDAHVRIAHDARLTIGGEALDLEITCSMHTRPDRARGFTPRIQALRTNGNDPAGVKCAIDPIRPVRGCQDEAVFVPLEESRGSIGQYGYPHQAL